jgi:hypothetical protein
MFALVKTVKNLSNEDVQIIKLFAPYTNWEDKNGTQYGPESLFSLTPTQKQNLGIYDVAYAPRPDDRFYSVWLLNPHETKNEGMQYTYYILVWPMNDCFILVRCYNHTFFL